MILYTPLSQAEVFPESGSEFENLHCISHEGRLLIAEQNKNGSYRLVQLLSTDPQDFLDPKYTPGEMFQ